MGHPSVRTLPVFRRTVRDLGDDPFWSLGTSHGQDHVPWDAKETRGVSERLCFFWLTSGELRWKFCFAKMFVKYGWMKEKCWCWMILMDELVFRVVCSDTATRVALRYQPYSGKRKRGLGAFPFRTLNKLRVWTHGLLFDVSNDSDMYRKWCFPMVGAKAKALFQCSDCWYP